MKSGLLSLIIAELGGRLSRLSKAAIEAHAAATDPGSKAEGKYDTRSLEASYLATGQARQVEDGGVKWSKHAIDVFGPDCFGRIVFKEVIASRQAADNDNIFPARVRQGSGDFC